MHTGGLFRSGSNPVKYGVRAGYRSAGRDFVLIIYGTVFWGLKHMLRPIYTLSLAACVLTMCKKESVEVAPVPLPPMPDTELTRGLPENPHAIHGYFFFAYNYYRDNANATYTTSSCYAQFCDPPSNLMASIDRNYQPLGSAIKSCSNVDMGNVRFNNYFLNSSQNYNNSDLFHYQLNYYDHPELDQRVAWSVSGNEIIPKFEQRIKDEFPVPKALGVWLGVDCKTDYVVDPAFHFDRWDSVLVQIKGNVGPNDYILCKRTGNDSSLVFGQKELDFYRNGDAKLTVKAYRFFHRRIAGRLYVFELGTSVEYKLYVTR